MWSASIQLRLIGCFIRNWRRSIYLRVGLVPALCFYYQRERMMTVEIYDLIIVGAGPAGMTAGVFAVRKGLKTLVISKDIGGQVNLTSDIENYMGFSGIDGVALIEKFQAQIKEHNLKEILDEVVSLEKSGTDFVVKTTNNGDFTGRTLILSSGKKPRTLDVPGEAALRNRGVSYCSTCDAPLFRNIPVVVVGGGNSAAKAAMDLLNYASEIQLISLGELTADAVLVERLQKSAKIKIMKGFTVQEIKGSKAVEGVIIENLATKERSELAVQGVFVEIGLEPNTGYINGLVQLNEAGEIQVDCLCETGVPGVFAAGDVSSVPEKQIIIAAGDGAKAAIRAWEYLINMNKDVVQS